MEGDRRHGLRLRDSGRGPLPRERGAGPQWAGGGVPGEPGHLVLGTLHTTTAASTVDRIIDQFPADRQAQIRIMLSESLKGVIAQTLCKMVGGGRVAAREILLTTPAIANLIREGKTFQIPSIIQTSKKLGMVTLNDSLLDLVEKKMVVPDEAYMKSVEKAG